MAALLRYNAAASVIAVGRERVMLSSLVKKLYATRAQTEVNAPVERVFSYVADFTHHPEWRKGLDKVFAVTKTSQGPVGVGSTFTMLVRQPDQMSESSYTPGSEEHVDVQVTDFVPNERLAWNSRSERFIVEVQPTATGTLLKFSEEPLPGSVWGELLGLVIFVVSSPFWPAIVWFTNRGSPRRQVRAIQSRLEPTPASRTAGHPAEGAVQHYQRGLELGDEGRWREAVSEFDRAISLNPDHVNAYAQRGFAYAELGETDRAIADMQRARAFARDRDTIADLESSIKELREGGRG